MTKYKVAELEGKLLDAAVALCEGDFDPHRPRAEFQMLLNDGRRVLAGPQGFATKMHEWSPSTNWSVGGPIIERERISVQFDDGESAWTWWATCIGGHEGFGPTPLIAAARAIVARRFGECVELP